MVVGTASKGCQVAVIGSGPGGYLAAIRLAQLGKDVILIEKSKTLGGICLNEGCIPSKALLHAADFKEEAERAGQMGLTIPEVTLNLPGLMKWKDRIVRKLTGGVKFLVEKNGAEILHGRATFLTDRRLEVFTDEGPVFVEFEQAVICTGSSPVTLSELECDGDVIITPREALSLETVPGRLAVIGAGYIGLELGSVYRRFGAQVDIIDISERILSRHDPEVRDVVRKRLETIGISLHLGCRPDEVIPGDPVRIQLESVNGDSSETLETDMILVAVGRKPNSEDLGLDAAGVDVDSRGFIQVNDRMETNVPGLFALGDVVGGPLLAHKAYREAKVAAEVISGNSSAFDNVVIPAVVYTDPEIAWAGLTEREAKEDGYTVKTGTFPFKASGRAMTLNAVEGFVKTVADADTNRILGVSIVGRDASEMISEAALAIEMGAFLDDLSQTIHPHPTLSEGLLESVEAALGEAAHIINTKRE
jgi:dihydrolipoyl dehydrogenase